MAQTGGSLDKIDALGRVKITTPTEILTGDRGTYNAKTERAVITGNVKITRGPNVLTGERAELDMTTQISRMYGSSIEDGQTGGRVRGLFFPKSRE
jgi:lipopolysaccharide export system protein LptA